MSEKIKAQLVLEIMGKPAEYVSKSMNTLVEQIEKDEGVTITSQAIHEPKPVKESKDIFTTFADLTIEFENIGSYLHTVFAYMPSHVEIFSPEKFSLSNYDLNEVANRITQRLHAYDAIAKQMLAEKEFLLEKLKQNAPEVFKEITTPSESTQEPTPEEKKEKTKTK